MLETLLYSKAEVDVLGVVLFHDGLHLREIARRAKRPAPQAMRELDRLVRAGLLRHEKKGSMKLFFLDKTCPYQDELRSIYRKTEGLAPALGEAMKLIAGVRFAFIYGSFAQAQERQPRDVDVLVVGGKTDPLDEACFALQRRYGREINYIHWSDDDLRKKLKERGAFISSILRKRRLWLVGDEDEFGRLAKKPRD